MPHTFLAGSVAVPMLLSTCLIACGGLIGDDPWTPSEGPVQGARRLLAVSEASCSTQWDVLHQGPANSVGPKHLIRLGESLAWEYLTLNTLESWVHQQPIALGEGMSYPLDQFANQLWEVDGQALIWGSGSLSRLPTAGGPIESVFSLDSFQFAQQPGPALIWEQMLYWTQRVSLQTISLEQLDLDTLAQRQIRELPGGAFEQPSLHFTPRGILASSRTGEPTVLPLGTEPPFRLPTPRGAEQVEFGSRGLYSFHTYNRTEQGGHADRIEVLLTSVEGGEPERIWRGEYGQFLSSIWEVPEGWIATGQFYRLDGSIPAVVVAIDESGNDRLLACHLGVERFLTPPVIWNGRLYAVGVQDGRWSVQATTLEGLDPDYDLNW